MSEARLKLHNIPKRFVSRQGLEVSTKRRGGGEEEEEEENEATRRGGRRGRGGKERT